MPARSTTHRSRFLAGLSARLGEEQTLRDHADAPDWEEPAAADEPAPRELQDGSERDARGQAFSPPSPWSEAGMPKRLREAIASVRRVSHHMAHELPPLGAQPVYEGPALDDEASHEARSFEADTIRDQPPFDDEIHEQPSFDDDAIDDEPLRYDDLREESPFDADAIDDARRYGGLREEPPLDDEMQEQRSFEAEAVEDELPFGDDAIDERFEGSAPVGPARGSWEDSEDRLPVRRRAAPRRGLHVAAFAVAIAFVVGAGLGLGLVYGGWGAGSPPVAPNAAVVAAIEPPAASMELPAASSAPVARPPEPTPPQPQPRPTQVVIQEQPTQVVIREMPPLPAAPVSEAPPSSAEAPKDLPLPPPPKPSFRQVATSDAPPADDRLARPADDRLASEADEPRSDSLEEGLGGPFQPLFVKLTASRVAPTQVLLHYPAGAAGAPATAMHLVRHLKAEGFRVEPRAVDFPIPTTSIRYFADADRGRAESVRASLEGQIPGGAALPILDFTHFEPKPQAGHLEIWLSL